MAKLSRKKYVYEWIKVWLGSVPQLATESVSKSSQVYSLNGIRMSEAAAEALLLSKAICSVQNFPSRRSKLPTTHFLTFNKACFNTWERTVLCEMFYFFLLHQQTLFFPNLRCKRGLNSKHWIMRERDTKYFFNQKSLLKSFLHESSLNHNLTA